ncbi:MAG: hypothetical protein KDA44_11200 [Planctomycetales bacterium]|nr:hypothetical protein [Planctomycetales bacterium]
MTRFVLAFFLAAFVCLGATAAVAKPPRVVKASPDNGDIGVDPQTRELRITFDQPMEPGGMSVVGGGEAFPEPTGKPKWLDRGRTFVLPIKLQADHEYWLSINNAKYANFQNRAGESAIPYPISFRTGKSGGQAESANDGQQRHAVELAREAVDSAYSYRDRLGLDWDELFDAAEAPLAQSNSAKEFARQLGTLLAKAEDKHIWLVVNNETIPSFVRPPVPNANFKLLSRLVPNWTMHGQRIASGRWDDGVGYLAIGNWTAADVADQLLPALEQVQKSNGLIIDVRGNGGGDERLAQQLAGCFTDKRLLYGTHVYRDPESPTGFGPVQERWLEPNPDGPQIKTRVVVLTGPVVMSSCESFLLMMKAAGATLVGDRSQGSSGNPKPHDLGNGVVLYLPSWKDMTADGDPLEGVGVPADVVVSASRKDFERADPVLEAGLRVVRETPAEEPAP